MLFTIKPPIVSEVFAKSQRLFELIKLSFKSNRAKAKSESLRYIESVATKKQLIFSIGVQQHQHLVLMRKWIGRLGRIIVFATNDKSFANLYLLSQLAGWKNVQVEVLQTDIIPDDSFSNGEETIDAFCALSKLQPDIIEIKLKGSEHQVLFGAPKTLQKYKPRIVMESENRFADREYLFEVFQYILEAGYKGYFLLDNIKIPLHNFDFDVYQNPRSNFYCNTFIFE
jgi:hypothetical protein